MNINDLVKNAFVAAIYVVLTVVVAPSLSYHSIQFRISEALLILVLFNRKYWLGLIVGTFIANLFSPLGVIDWVVGTGASVLSIYLMLLFKKNLWLSLIMPVVINAVLVGLELKYLFDLPLLLTMAEVAFGEFVVVVILGGLLYKALENNKGFLELIN